MYGRISCLLLSALAWACTTRNLWPETPGGTPGGEPSGPDATVVSVAYVRSLYRGYPLVVVRSEEHTSELQSR